LDHLNKEVLRKICNEVDEHLRLLMHSMLIEKLKSKNPFETPTKPVHHYLENGPIELFGTIIDPIEHVSNYLDETFYNLNILNLHDYETYEGLRNLAEHLFGVDLLHVIYPMKFKVF
jgi:WASH complex subunit 7